jgi:hypothetical protein
VRRDTLSFGASVNRIKHTKFHRRLCALLWVRSGHLRSAVRRTCRTGRSPSVSGLDPKPRPTERHGSCRGAPPSPGRCPRKCGPIPASDTQIALVWPIEAPHSKVSSGFRGLSANKGGCFAKGTPQIRALRPPKPPMRTFNCPSCADAPDAQASRPLKGQGNSLGRSTCKLAVGGHHTN